MNHIKNIEDLENLIYSYHGRDGTFDFHYSHFDLLSWRSARLEEDGLSKADYERTETEGYAVKIVWTDNSHSYNSYTVLLKDIIEWADKR
jgi:hypothetical protein